MGSACTYHPAPCSPAGLELALVGLALPIQVFDDGLLLSQGLGRSRTAVRQALALFLRGLKLLDALCIALLQVTNQTSSSQQNRFRVFSLFSFFLLHFAQKPTIRKENELFQQIPPSIGA